MTTKQQLAKNTKALQELLKRPENKLCADCYAPGPTFASINLGVFICTRCSGFHRKLGVHVSRVKSISQDQWTNEQVEFMRQTGNKKAKDKYMWRAPKPVLETETHIFDWIRRKYERKEFLRPEGAPDEPPEDSDDEPDMTSPPPPTNPLAGPGPYPGGPGGALSPRGPTSPRGEAPNPYGMPQQPQPPQQPQHNPFGAPGGAAMSPHGGPSGQPWGPGPVPTGPAGGPAPPGGDPFGGQPRVTKDDIMQLYARPLQPQAAPTGPVYSYGGQPMAGYPPGTMYAVAPGGAPVMYPGGMVAANPYGAPAGSYAGPSGIPGAPGGYPMVYYAAPPSGGGAPGGNPFGQPRT